MKLHHATTVVEALQESGLNWEVYAEPITVPRMQGIAWLPEGREYRDNTEFRAIRRADTGTVLGVVRGDYNPMQNHEALSVADGLLREGARLERAWSWGKGRRVTLEILLPSKFLVKSDEIASRLILTKGHDGGCGVHAIHELERLICENGMTASRAHQIAIVTHRSRTEDAVRHLRQRVEAHTTAARAHVETFRRMAEKPYSVDRFREEMIPAVFERPFADLRAGSMLVGNYEWTSTREQGGDTLWTAYNAVTRFTSHQRGRDSTSRRMAMLTGDGNRLRQRAFNFAVAELN